MGQPVTIDPERGSPIGTGSSQLTNTYDSNGELAEQKTQTTATGGAVDYYAGDTAAISDQHTTTLQAGGHATSTTVATRARRHCGELGHATMTRVPVRPTYDAVVGLDPRRHLSRVAFALVKLTYEIKDGGSAHPARTAAFDLWSDEESQPRFPPVLTIGWTSKVRRRHPRIRLCARGAAHSLDVCVGADRPHDQRIAVFGKRLIESSHGQPRLSRPEPSRRCRFSIRMPTAASTSVPIPAHLKDDYMRTVALGLQFDHPGLYPRNPVGKGYLVIRILSTKSTTQPGRSADLLTAERLITRKPELWYRQPLPWCFDWTVGLTFPRYLFMASMPGFHRRMIRRCPRCNEVHCPGLRRELEKDHDLAAATCKSIARHGRGHSALWATRHPARMHPEEPTISFTVPLRRRSRLRSKASGLRCRPCSPIWSFPG